MTIKLNAQVTITDDQARWCLENNDKVKIYEEAVLIKDSIIHLQEVQSVRYEAIIGLQRQRTRNDSVMFSNQNVIILSEQHEKKTLKKENKKLKVKNVLLTILVAAEFVAIITLSL